MANSSPTPPAGSGDRAVEIVAAAVLNYARRPPLMACKHVVRDGAGAVLCASHPQAGLQCGRCSCRHVGRHDDAAERTCDYCQQGVDELHQVVVAAPLARELRIRDPRGYARPFIGVVAVVGIGCCEPCREADGRHEVGDIPTGLEEKGWRL
ncbi:MAG TPA: hypothetical protein VGR26_06765 [Acidimicrobiales bacterium]|nr:hypothetical protein [Acidimicrobiales bacterium]